MKKVAIVGTGPSGIMALRWLKPLFDKGEVEVVAYEKQSTFGGLWNYSEKSGIDRWGEICPGSMYRKLWINGPAEAIEVPDFLFPDEMPSYTPREVITDWWRKYVAKFELEKFMKFDTRVENVTFDKDTKRFSVTTRGFGSSPEMKEFDYLLVASGHFSFPHDPSFEGIDTFPGRVMHAHDFRDGRQFKNQSVLCIGGSYSAEDIAMQCWRMGASKTTITSRKGIGYAWPEGMEEKSILTHIEGSTVFFKDGSKGDYDAIIKCTGYVHQYPFLPDDLTLKTTNVLAPPLYRQTVFPNNTQLLYLGMMDQYFSFQMFWAQGCYVSKIISGEIDLPPRDEMLKYIQTEQELESRCKNSFENIDFQARHVNYFTEATGLPNVNIGYILHLWLKEKKEGITTFRDRSHKSHFTGKEAPPAVPKWLDALLMD